MSILGFRVRFKCCNCSCRPIASRLGYNGEDAKTKLEKMTIPSLPNTLRGPNTFWEGLSKHSNTRVWDCWQQIEFSRAESAKWVTDLLGPVPGPGLFKCLQTSWCSPGSDEWSGWDICKPQLPTQDGERFGATTSFCSAHLSISQYSLPRFIYLF